MGPSGPESLLLGKKSMKRDFGGWGRFLRMEEAEGFVLLTSPADLPLHLAQLCTPGNTEN